MDQPGPVLTSLDRPEPDWIGLEQPKPTRINLDQPGPASTSPDLPGPGWSSVFSPDLSHLNAALLKNWIHNELYEKNAEIFHYYRPFRALSYAPMPQSASVHIFLIISMNSHPLCFT